MTCLAQQTLEPLLKGSLDKAIEERQFSTPNFSGSEAALVLILAKRQYSA